MITLLALAGVIMAPGVLVVLLILLGGVKLIEWAVWGVDRAHLGAWFWGLE